MKKKDLPSSFVKELKTALYFIKQAQCILKRYIPILFCFSFIEALSPLASIVMSKFIIDEMLGMKRVEILVCYIVFTIVMNVILSFFQKLLKKIIDIDNKKVQNGFELRLGQHIMAMDFESLENPEVLDLKEKALYPLKTGNTIEMMINHISTIIRTSCSLLFLIALIATLNIWLLVIIISLLLLSSYLFKKSQSAEFSFHQQLIPVNRKFMYYYDLTSDFSMAKDVRIYNMAPMILDKIKGFNKESIKVFGKLSKITGNYGGLVSIIMSFQMILAYAYMVFRVFIKSISLGDFTMYIGATINFSSQMNQLISSVIALRQSCRYLEPYARFENIPTREKKGCSKIKSLETCEIEFRDVWFRYPRIETYVLNGISLKISAGTKLSIVGENGAGKSTFVKLLCRLYSPEKGVILLNGIDIHEYDYIEYLRILSVVFQDFKLFAFTLKENIVFEHLNDISDKEVFKVLEKSGLDRIVDELPNKIYTPLYKIFDQKSIELSGGQNQKVAIARALYKNAPVLILDEPTAALDPYAEYDIYNSFQANIKKQTTIFISHRLSSTRFCDKIVVFKNGNIVEFGNHDELVTLREGYYARMWNAQAVYYQ